MEGILTTGFITDNQDPEQNGRVKARIYLSQVYTETDWLPMLTPFAGEGTGLFSLPDVDDFVLIAFMDRSYRKGYVLGTTWTLSGAPPVSEENGDADLNSDGNNALKMFRSKGGQRVILDDTEGAEKIQILNPDGTSRIEINAEEEMINLTSEVDVTLQSSTFLSIEAEEIQMETEGDLTQQAENYGVEAAGDSNLKGDGGVVLEGKGVGIN